MNANIFSRKIEMSKAEAKAAGKIGSEKFEELRQYMNEFPGFEIQIKAPTKRKVELKGLDYKYMRNYIQKCERDDKGEIMEKFNTLIAQDKKDGKEGAEHLEAAGYLDKNIDLSGKNKRDLERFNAKKQKTADWLRKKANGFYF